MMRNPATHFIFALIILAVVCGGYALWYGKVEAESAKVATLQSEIQNKTQDSQRAQQAKQELGTLSAVEGTVGQYFISTNDVVPFLEQLAQTGQYLGSKVDVVSVSANPGTPYGTLQLSLKVTGSFDAVLRTMGSIEYSPYGTTVTSFTLDAANNTTSSNAPQQWTATAMVTVGTESNKAAGTAPAPTASSTISQPVSNTPSATTSPVNLPAPKPTASPTATP